ncbi:MAG: oxidoreductase-like domain-containing protein [Burkholderiales bacterium]|nr:oxidoreductase-like domain-containing protein [Burkholderiales bacterium]
MSTPIPPRKPEPHECCGTGCIPCVMDIYEEELYEYEKALRLLGAGSAQPAALSAGPMVQAVNTTFDPV